MNAPATVSFTGDYMRVAGDIDFTSVVALEQQGERWLLHEAPITCRVDLSAVRRSNSAGTALLISWIRTATVAGKRLTIEQVPPGLSALLHLGGLDDVLPALERV